MSLDNLRNAMDAKENSETKHDPTDVVVTCYRRTKQTDVYVLVYEARQWPAACSAMIKWLSEPTLDFDLGDLKRFSKEVLDNV